MLLCAICKHAPVARSLLACRVTNAAAVMELLLAGGPLSHVRVLDVGPTFATLKTSMGLHPLGFRATLRRAAWS